MHNPERTLLLSTRDNIQGNSMMNFDFSGPYLKLKPGQTVKAGSSVPVEFSLAGDEGLSIFAAGSPSVAACSGGPSVPAVGFVADNPWSKQYTYLWKTDKSWARTCQVFTLTLVDGTSHSVSVTFR